LNLVIDASVLIKFFVPEILSESSGKLLDRVEEGEVHLLAPDLIYSEVGNILWKKHRLKELTLSETDEITGAMLSLPLQGEAIKPLLPLALSLAIAYRVTVYDATYLSLATIYETRLVTADRKLVDAIAKTELKKHIEWIGNY